MGKKLPVYLQPLVLTQCMDAEIMALLMTETKYIPWIYENYISVWMDGKNNIKYDHEINAIAQMKKYDEVLKFTFFNYTNNIVNEVKDAIDNNQYIFMYVDSYFIPSSKNYHKEVETKNKEKHALHEIIIYGYLEEELLFMSYNLHNAVFGVSSCKASVIIEALTSALRIVNGNYFNGYAHLYANYLPLSKVELNREYNRKLSIERI